VTTEGLCAAALQAFRQDTNSARFSFTASFEEIPRFYSSGSKTLWSGIGSGNLTLDGAFRQGAELAAGSRRAGRRPAASLPPPRRRRSGRG
jgi:hypothetical protein